MNNQRRRLLRWLATGVGFSAVHALAAGSIQSGAPSTKVVVIGGGFAGATFARTLHRLDPTVSITLIEPNRHYHCCPLGAEFLVGKRSEQSLMFSYDKLIESGIEVVYDYALSLDARSRQIFTRGGRIFSFDRCVVATGIGYRYDTIAGYDHAVAQQFPHAWGGGEQLRLLNKQLNEMPNGGAVLIAAPPDDYRCPPGPYERASLIAEYLKVHKPLSRVIVLDAKERFAKQAQFEQAWKRLYGYGTDSSVIRWIGAKEGGTVRGVDVEQRQLLTDGGRVGGDVINIIPAQRADDFSHSNGLTADHGWCPVDTQTLESLQVPGVHVIGDAAYAERLPKSAFAATCQARVCAMAIHNQVHGLPLLTPQFMNVCYSLCGDDYGISVFLHYQHDPANNILEVQTLRVTPMDASQEEYVREANAAYSMFDTMVKEAFG
ncbi:Sulfide dehydrogenase [flavocytochrome c] flavoprotein chain [Pseudomonas fluorescens]|uniref:Sulfide dehydrogenase [flavocytochrome c] flavoprotein chain n=1 Tax=Pseudomonas fluorescens TaxID=294 RepID=A0A5E7NA51_PSEFL|nr:FAD-dependent oxidoreductase [Pseudomonas fluorescens]VVP34036.1 Sulfide dehydrogenase [flavocytochrome c] flavoprotein chain [Pseudomonas fluorescens]